MDYHQLLYVLEKVKAACASEHGVFHTWSETEEDAACQQLAKDGLIQLAISDDEHRAWRYN